MGSARTIASACLGMAAAIGLLAACLPDPVPATEPRGHEETPAPTATPGPFPAPKPKSQPAARVVEPTPKPPALLGCRSLGERIASITKAAPDAQAAQVAAL